MAVAKIEIELFERERETIHHDKLKVQRIEFYESFLKCTWIYESDRWKEDEAIKEHAQLDNTYWVFRDALKMPVVLYSNKIKCYALNICDVLTVPTIYFKTKKEAMNVAEEIVKWKLRG